MKIALTFIALCFFVVSSNAQSKTIDKAEYDKARNFAVSGTNSDYPVILKVTIEYIEDGKTVRKETTINENEAPGRHRSKQTIFADGKETNKYQINAGFGNVYCSNDGVSWDPPSEYECERTRRLSGPRETESIEYSVTGKVLEGKKIKVYREYSVFAPKQGSTMKYFSEVISTIDSRGFFITVAVTQGKLDPKTITQKTEQSWITKAKIKPVVPPIK